MRIKPVIYGVLVLGVFLGTIFIFQRAGIWSVSGKITTDGQQAQPSATDLNTIKGWMTLEQISNTYHIPLVDILTQFNLPLETAPSTAIKDLETDLFSITNLRLWLESRLQPSQSGNPTLLPAQQVDPTPADPALTNTAQAEPSTLATPLPTEHLVADKTITGKTTFQELLDWGLSPEVVQGVIGSELPETSMAVKDFITQKGIEFTTVKTALQLELDKLK